MDLQHPANPTLAELLAKKLGFFYFDTGVMYRGGNIGGFTSISKRR